MYCLPFLDFAPILSFEGHEMRVFVSSIICQNETKWKSEDSATLHDLEGFHKTEIMRESTCFFADLWEKLLRAWTVPVSVDYNITMHKRYVSCQLMQLCLRHKLRRSKRTVNMTEFTEIRRNCRPCNICSSFRLSTRTLSSVSSTSEASVGDSAGASLSVSSSTEAKLTIIARCNSLTWLVVSVQALNRNIVFSLRPPKNHVPGFLFFLKQFDYQGANRNPLSIMPVRHVCVTGS